MKPIFFLVALAFLTPSGRAQLITSPNNSPSDLAQIIAGSGVIVSNATLNCANAAVGEFDGTNCNVGLNAGVIMTSGGRVIAEGPNNQSGAGQSNNWAGDADLTSIASSPTHDACILEFDVYAPADTLMFNFVFGSEEYLEYVGSYNDAFGFFVSGPGINGPYANNAINIALIPGTNIPVTINNVNNVNNSSWYINNGTGSNPPYNSNPYYIQYDGFTKVMTAVVAVQPCQTYHMKLAVADALDFIYDSGVFIEANSLVSNAASVSAFTSAGIQDMVEGCVDGIFLFQRSIPDTAAITINYSVVGTATMGVDYPNLSGKITIPANQTQATLTIPAYQDGITEGPESIIIRLSDPCYGNIIDSAVLWIQDTLVHTITNDTSICPGSSINLQATGGASYSWTPATWLSNPVAPNPVATPADTITYHVTITAGTCSVTDSVTVNVNPPLIADPGPDTTICQGDSIQLNAYQPNIVTYWWAPQGGLSDYTIANPKASPPATLTYFLTVTDNIGCVAYGDITIGVKPKPYADAGNGGTICFGDSLQLHAIGPGTYTWQPGSSLNDSTLANPWAMPPATTDYTLTVTATNGCYRQDSVTVVVTPLPNADAGPDTAICEGGSVQLQASGGAAYTWAPAYGLSATNIANPVANPMVTTTYTVTMNNIYGCINSDSVTVTVYHKEFANAGNDTAICIGSSTQLHASGGVSYSWSPISYLSNPTIPDPISYPIGSITYVVDMVDAYGCIDDDTVNITVNPLPMVTVTPKDTALCLGNQVKLQASGGTIYNWSPVSSLSDPSIANPVASPTATTTYTVLVTDANGCSRSDTARVQINALPNVSAGPDVAICAGGSAQLQGSGGIIYSWSPATGLNNPNIANPVASPAVSTQYTLTASDGNGCSNTDVVTVTVNPLPPADAGADQAGCAGSLFSLNATGGILYQWAPATGLSNISVPNPTANPQSTTKYTVTVTDANGCMNTDSVTITIYPLPVVSAGNDVAICPGGSTQLSASGAQTYNWSPATGLSNPNIANPVAAPAVSTAYSVIGIDQNGCSGTDTILVTVFPATVANAGPDTAICLGDIAQLHASGGVSYQWQPASGLNNPSISNPQANISASTMYTVTVTDANGCTGTDSILVTLNQLPVITLAQGDTSICEGDQVQLGASGGISYSWSPPVTLNNPNIANPVATPIAATTYQVTVTDANGCVNTAQLTVDFYPPTNPNAQPADTYICPGDAVQLSASNGVSYTWMPPDGLDNPNSPNPMASPASTQTYTVTIIDIYGCDYSDQVTVNVWPSAVAHAGPDQVIVTGQMIQLNGSGGISYDWTPPDGLSDPNIPDPLASPQSSTWYTLHVVDINGCEDWDSVYIEVRPLTTVYIPNAFSPNGDGQNDVYYVEDHNDFTLVSFRIFNRWGELVFETNDPSKGWDGTFDGKKQPVGTYVYILEGYGSLGERIFKRGNITLLR